MIDGYYAKSQVPWPSIIPGLWHGFCVPARWFLKFRIQNLFFGKLFRTPEQLHADCRSTWGRWVYDRGAPSLWVANPTVGLWGPGGSLISPALLNPTLGQRHCLIVALSLTTGQTKYISLIEAVADSRLGRDALPMVEWALIWPTLLQVPEVSCWALCSPGLAGVCGSLADG
jgi:hypothetical protein